MVRVIPVLLLTKKGLVKTTRFTDPKYIGDAINAVRIFNEKEVDELILLNIDSSRYNIEINYSEIEKIVSESYIPLGYGGGVKDFDQAKRLFDLGLEKVIINSASNDLKLLENISKVYGSQSVAVSIDVRKTFFGKFQIFGESGTRKFGDSPDEMARKVVESGAGEIIIQSIDNDGLMKGYDLSLIKLVAESVNVPVVASGGAGCVEDFIDALQSGATSVAAGSLFVYHGKHKAVLINYPGYSRLSILNNYLDEI